MMVPPGETPLGSVTVVQPDRSLASIVVQIPQSVATNGLPDEKITLAMLSAWKFTAHRLTCCQFEAPFVVTHSPPKLHPSQANPRPSLDVVAYSSRCEL